MSVLNQLHKKMLKRSSYKTKNGVLTTLMIAQDTPQ